MNCVYAPMITSYRLLCKAKASTNAPSTLPQNVCNQRLIQCIKSHCRVLNKIECCDDGGFGWQAEFCRSPAFHWLRGGNNPLM